MADAELDQLLDELKPVVLVNRDTQSTTTPVVAADYRTALGELLDLLRRLWPPVVGLSRRGAGERSPTLRRLEAVRDFLDDHPDSFVEEIMPCGVSFADGYEACRARSRLRCYRCTGV